jgi:Icc-related predicted phosphoesterase
MRVACLADQHGQLDFTIPDCDLILHAGDICPDWRTNSAFHQLSWMNREFRNWLDTQPQVPFVGTWGNHDWVGYSNMPPQLQAQAQVVIDKEVTVNGLKIYATPWSKQFFNWAFMGEEAELDGRFARIPYGLDILLVHGPAYGLCDDNAQGEPCGSQALLKHIKRTKPRYVICGHIHEARGNDILLHPDLTETHIVNVSLVDAMYDLYPNPVTMLDIGGR